MEEEEEEICFPPPRLEHVLPPPRLEHVLPSGVVTLILLNLDLHDAFSFGRCCKHFLRSFVDKQHLFRRLEMEFGEKHKRETNGDEQKRRGKGAAKKNRQRMQQQKLSLQSPAFADCAQKYQEMVELRTTCFINLAQLGRTLASSDGQSYMMMDRLGITSRTR